MPRSAEILAEITRIYDDAIACLRADIGAYAAARTLPPSSRQADGSWCYPELRIRYSGNERNPEVSRAFGRLARAGEYATTVTRPRLFADYIGEQLDLLTADYAVELSVDRSQQAIPFPYVLDVGADLNGLTPVEIAQIFPSTELAHIGDELADGIEAGAPGDPLPLALFDALRTDFSLARLTHYTGTPAGAFPALHPVHQLPPLCRRVRRLGRARSCGSGSRYAALSGAGGLVPRRRRPRTGATGCPTPPGARHQMPAYHLIARGRRRGSPWSTSASARPTPRRSTTISRCCAPRHG